MLLLFAAGLAGFMGLVGMAVDVGHVVYTRTDLQKIADAAVLAGVQDLPGSTTNATDSASLYASKNGVSTQSISFSTAATPNDTITVTATRHVDYVFLKMVGLSGTNVSATAAARATSKTITGYSQSSFAPFIIWGGSRQSEVHAGDNTCSLHTCVGRSYTFLDTGWMGASGNPKVPDWTANGSNNFKGDVDHGNGAEVTQIGDIFSGGGLGSVTAPAVGSTLVIPIVSNASGNANNRQFTVAAWAIVRVDPGCTKQHCTGTVQDSTTTAPAGWSTSGSVQPPSSLTYKGTTTALIQ